MIRGHGTLEERQLEMKSRIEKRTKRLQQAKEVQHNRMVNDQSPDRIFCIADCGRLARAGSTLCSRCSQTALTDKLRDKLPDSMLPVPKIVTPEPAQGEVNDQTTISLGIVSNTDVNNDVPDESTSSETITEKYYTSAEVTKIVGISKTTLSRWESKGKIPMPLRIRHNNQRLYTEELLQKIKDYASEQYVPQSPAAQAGTIEALPRVAKQTIKINKRLERGVASRIGSLGRKIF